MPTLDWIGKEAVVNHHLEVPYRLLKCDSSLSAGDPEAGNLLVQGDNLLALKALLPYYAGQVKCIYIDPPYNTGNENWVYNDNVNSPEIRSWLNDVVGKEGDDLSRHDKWLCMMYPRLQLLRKFLREDGVIFVSIDDNEHHNLRTLLNQIFGERNFVGCLKWKRKKQPSYLHGHIALVMEYVIVFAKSIKQLERLSIEKREDFNTRLDNASNAVSERLIRKGIRVKLPDNVVKISKGSYKIRTMEVEYLDDVYIEDGRTTNDCMMRGRFRNNQEQIDTFVKEDVLFITRNYGLRRDLLKEELQKRKSITDLLLDWGDNQDSDKELTEIFPEGKPFGYPKPSLLIRNLIASVQTSDSIILDSFAGSGTTGHAVLQLNKEDGGNRRFILVEMDEKICQTVTAERLKRVINGYGDKEPLGGGFRYCKLGEPLFDQHGSIQKEVSFNDLAHHIFFTETGLPLPKNAKKNSPLIGVHKGVAYYLLFNGILGDKSVDGGNILTSRILDQLPNHDGPKIIYGEGTRLSFSRLRKQNITFKQVPYEIKTS
jgi:adenine-specific DNA-methyltransferase